MKYTSLSLSLTVAAFTLGLGACSGDDNNDANNGDRFETVTFRVTMTNTTHNQPLSPPAVILSATGRYAWDLGLPASDGLEVLSESGSPSAFVAAFDGLVSATGAEVIMPGQSVTLSLTTDADEPLALTVVSMLVNTNDGFTGVTAWPVSHLARDGLISVLAPIYDAGTEANMETADSVPGPAAGGEGFNALRDDVDFVSRHPGVVTADDGYDASVLDQSHRFDNGAMAIAVTRF